MATVRSLYLEPFDGRPESALRTHWLSGPSILGGALALVLVPLAFAAVVLVAWLVTWLLRAAVALFVAVVGDAEPAPEPVLEEEDVIEARFVQLGRDFQDELPNREVPVLSTAPPEPSQIPREDTPQQQQPTERVEDRPPNTVDDLIARLDRRAELFEEIAERRELEGSPEGIEEGTEREGSEGDIYRGRLMSFFRRGWSIPTTLSRDAVQGLVVMAHVQIGPELQIVSFELRGTSGNPVFDESVNQQLMRLQASDQRIPPPPEEVADQYIGRAVAVRYRGRDAR